MNNNEKIATLEMLLTRLGLTGTELAEILEVNESTVRRWRKTYYPKNNISELYLEQLRQLDEDIDQYALIAHDTILSQYKEQPVALICYVSPDDLERYHPDWQKNFKHWRTHWSMISRLTLELEEDAIPYSLVPMEPDNYEAWLRKNNAEDTVVTRTNWAIEKTFP